MCDANLPPRQSLHSEAALIRSAAPTAASARRAPSSRRHHDDVTQRPSDPVSYLVLHGGARVRVDLIPPVWRPRAPCGRPRPDSRGAGAGARLGGRRACATARADTEDDGSEIGRVRICGLRRRPDHNDVRGPHAAPKYAPNDCRQEGEAGVGARAHRTTVCLVEVMAR